MLTNETAGRVIASRTVSFDDALSRTRGLAFRRDVPADTAFVFEYDRIGRRGVHMLFVFVPLDVVWLQRGVVVARSRLRPFLGHVTRRADTFIELPAGEYDIIPGDELTWSAQ